MVMAISRTDRPGIPLLFLGALLASLLTGCREPTPTPTQVVYFIPPTAGTGPLDSQMQEDGKVSTLASTCKSQLEFLDDLTIPDGTEIQAGAAFTKRWLVANTGSCPWNRDYTMELISGLNLGVAQTRALFPAQAGSQAVLEIIFTAPENPGRYNSWWQAFDPGGERFGDPVYVDILVVSDREE